LHPRLGTRQRPQQEHAAADGERCAINPDRRIRPAAIESPECNAGLCGEIVDAMILELWRLTPLRVALGRREIGLHVL
jgi:hypothetical protein